MNIEIVNIGDELLNGQVLNTNAQWLCSRFSELGHSVVSSTCIPDTQEAIDKALRNTLHDILILTGGLGPTKDDITKKVLCDFFDAKLVFHEQTMKHIKSIFETRGISMSELNHEQALLPDKCSILSNALGTAPGMWFENNNTIVISLPGVPYEMKHITDNEVIPRLSKLNNNFSCRSTSITVANIPESTLAERLKNYENNLPHNISLAYLPSPNYIRLRLSLTSSNLDIRKNTKQLEEKKDELIKLVENTLVSTTGETLAQIVKRKLKQHQLHLTIYDSACNGNLYKMLTEDSQNSESNISLVQHHSNCVNKFINLPETSLSIHIHHDNKNIIFEVYKNGESMKYIHEQRSDDYDLETTRASCAIMYSIIQVI